MDEINRSNETSDRDELNSATLDQLYKEQVSELRNSVLKAAESSDIEVCRKWLNVFNRISSGEKIERNCLCTLMQQQFNDFGCLSCPFTNLSNCNRNLKSVLQELDNPSYTSIRSFETESVATFKSHHVKCNPDEVVCGQPMNAELTELNTESIELKRKLDNLHLQLIEQQIENVKLKEIVEEYDNGSKGIKQCLDNIKAEILNCIRDKLLQLDGQYEEAINNLNLFHTTFQVHSTDMEFMEIIRKFDTDLEHILKTRMENGLSKQKVTISRQIFRKFLKKQMKMQEKCERSLTMQAVAHKLQIKLAKLKCFSVLRQMFIRSHSDIGKVDLWDVLKILEDKYQAVVNNI